MRGIKKIENRAQLPDSESRALSGTHIGVENEGTLAKRGGFVDRRSKTRGVRRGQKRGWGVTSLNRPHPEVEATTASGRVGGTLGWSNYQPPTNKTRGYLQRTDHRNRFFGGYLSSSSPIYRLLA